MASFDSPFPLLTLLQSLESEEDVEVVTFFLWMGAPGITHPGTGQYSPESFGWPGRPPEEVAESVKRHALSYLAQHRRGVLQVFPGADGQRAQGGQEQLDEIDATLQDVRSDGAELYGIECRCSPEGLEMLAEASGVVFRAVEVSSPGVQPIWPEDILRMRIVLSRGRYGIT